MEEVRKRKQRGEKGQKKRRVMKRREGEDEKQ